jgi:predicted ribosomally synthesized peptide with nif11-like leader
MSKEAFIKFYNEYVPSNPALSKQIDSLANEEQFAKLALEHGPKNGFSFTKDEMAAVMDASKAKMQGKKELSDAQLDAVSGGAAALAPAATVQIRSLNTAIGGAGGLQLPQGAGDTVMCCW